MAIKPLDQAKILSAPAASIFIFFSRELENRDPQHRGSPKTPSEVILGNFGNRAENFLLPGFRFNQNNQKNRKNGIDWF
jgi:hypothetical protein